ncbi:MAG: ABC transporter permease [Ignavibacteriae bacterium]|nr:ABC transporter permease [Ignavibacteria bacterium]MBI3364619.1 ABC transporter permease [Ignavibacteriota bacterium]
MKTLEVEHVAQPAKSVHTAPRPSHSNLTKYINIVRELAVADFRLKYHDSVLGYIWSMLNPMLMFAIYYFVFTRIFPSTIQYYPIFLLIGILSYAFFQDCTFSAMNSLSAKSGLMKKVYFPKSIIIFSSTSTCVLSYVINTLILLLLVGMLKGFSPLVLLLPIPIACLIIFSAGVAFLLATLYAYFRDMGQIWGVLVLVIFWISPIVFDVDKLPPLVVTAEYFNPLTRIFGLLRHYLLYDYFNLRFLLMTVLYSVATFILGFFVFQRSEKRLPELF